MNNYYTLLQKEEWKAKRQQILLRDGNKCDICSNYNLLKQFRISLSAIGTYPSGKVVMHVYDNELDRSHRCVTQYQLKEFKEIVNQKENSSVLCLSSGVDDFCKIISIIITNALIDYSSIEDYKLNDNRKYSIEKQKLQEKYLKTITKEEFKKLIWIDTKFLHIHHSYYHLDRNPWDYPDDALQTLCWKCHEDLHQNELIPVYDSTNNIIDQYTPCSKCFGAGYIPIYSHVQHGICFACHGKRFQELS